MCGAILTGVSAGVWVLRSHALRRNSGIWAFAAALIFLGACNSDPNSESDEVGPALSFASVAFGRGFAAALSTTARSPAGVTTTPVKPMRPRANSPRSWREPVTRARWRSGVRRCAGAATAHGKRRPLTRSSCRCRRAAGHRVASPPTLQSSAGATRTTTEVRHQPRGLSTAGAQCPVPPAAWTSSRSHRPSPSNEPRQRSGSDQPDSGYTRTVWMSADRRDRSPGSLVNTG